MDWNQLAQGTYQWRDLVNTKKNIRIQRKMWDFLSNCETISFQDSSCSLLYVKFRLTASDFSKCQLNSISCANFCSQLLYVRAVSLGFN